MIHSPCLHIPNSGGATFTITVARPVAKVASDTSVTELLVPVTLVVLRSASVVIKSVTVLESPVVVASQ